MKTIAIISQKGGVGKSTTTQNLAGGMSAKGFKVLVIDLDSQCNLSLASGADLSGTTILDLLTRRSAPSGAVQHTAEYDIIPASQNLSAADITLTETGKEYRLREVLERLQSGYDVCLLDCPPALGVLTVNALTASDTIIIPAQADLFSVQAIMAMADTVQTVRQYCNNNLSVAGVLLTRYNGRAILAQQMTDMISQTADEQLQTIVFKSRIRENTALKEAQTQQTSIFKYSPRSNGAADYGAFLDELLSVLKLNV